MITKFEWSSPRRSEIVESSWEMWTFHCQYFPRLPPVIKDAFNVCTAAQAQVECKTTPICMSVLYLHHENNSLQNSYLTLYIISDAVPFPQKSAGGSTQDEAGGWFALLGVNALNHGEQTRNKIKLEGGPMSNVMVALPNTGGALCSTAQSLADAHY